MKKTLIAMLVATTFAGNAVAAPTPSAYDSVQDGRIDAARMIADHANGQGANHEGRIQALEGNTAAQLNQINKYVNSVNTNQTGVNAVQSGQITTNANAITTNTNAIAANAGAINTLTGTVQQNSQAINSVQQQTGNFVQNVDYAKDKAAQATKDGDQDKLIKANGDASKTNTGDIAAIRNDLKQKADNGRVDSIQQMAQQNSVLAQDNAAKIAALPAGITQATYDAGQKAQDDKIADNGKKIAAVDGNLTQLTWNVTDNKDSIDDLKKHKVDVKTFTDGQKAQDQRIDQIEGDARMTRIDLGDEASARRAADTKLQAGVDANKTAVAAETTRATAEEHPNAADNASAQTTANSATAAAQAVQRNVDQTNKDVSQNRADVQTNRAAIVAHQTAIAGKVDTTTYTAGQAAQDAVIANKMDAKDVNTIAGNLAGRINTNATGIDTNKKSIDANKQGITDNGTAITKETSDRQKADDFLNKGIKAEAVRAGGEEQRIEGLVGKNTQSVATNQQNITANTNALTTKVDTTTYAADQKAQNDTIDRHHQEIMGNTARLTADEAELHSDTSRITANEGNIQDHEKRITKNSQDIVDQGNRLNGHETRITKNTQRLDNHESRIQDLEANKGYGNKFNDLKRDVEQNRKHASAGVAGVAAMANIPQVSQGANFSIGAGAGNYDGEQGLAVGASARFGAAGNVVTKFSVSATTQSDFVSGVGVSYEW